MVAAERRSRPCASTRWGVPASTLRPRPRIPCIPAQSCTPRLVHHAPNLPSWEHTPSGPWNDRFKQAAAAGLAGRRCLLLGPLSAPPPPPFELCLPLTHARCRAAKAALKFVFCCANCQNSTSHKRLLPLLGSPPSGGSTADCTSPPRAGSVAAGPVVLGRALLPALLFKRQTSCCPSIHFLRYAIPPGPLAKVAPRLPPQHSAAAPRAGMCAAAPPAASYPPNGQQFTCFCAVLFCVTSYHEGAAARRAAARCCNCNAAAARFTPQWPLAYFSICSRRRRMVDRTVTDAAVLQRGREGQRAGR